ncbi:MAG: flagellar protein FlaG [Desulfobacteraceae bacterium]|nr:flagellar protein FlaG [Desulfobacteraceae bacterium]
MNINTSTAVKEMAPIEIAGAPSRTGTAENNQIRQSSGRAKEEQNRVLSTNEAKELTREMNEIMDDLQTSLGFSIREELNSQIVVQKKNRDTNELIKQIPAEELLDIRQKMKEFTGLILDQSV